MILELDIEQPRPVEVDHTPEPIVVEINPKVMVIGEWN